MPRRFWTVVGWTRLDEHPGVVELTEPDGVAIVELGALRSDGQPTGRGNLALALGHTGPEPLRSRWTLSDGRAVVNAMIVGHAYGVGGDGVHSDPAVVIGVLAAPGAAASRALGISSSVGSGRLWIARGPYLPGERLPGSLGGRRPARKLPPIAGGAGSRDPPDHSRQVEQSGRTASWGGNYQQQAASHLSGLAARRPPWW